MPQGSARSRPAALTSDDTLDRPFSRSVGPVLSAVVMAGIEGCQETAK